MADVEDPRLDVQSIISRQLLADTLIESGQPQLPEPCLNLFLSLWKLEGLEAAVKEVCRVTRRGLCLGFFQMDEIPEHNVRPVDDYHWNTLSLDRTRALFTRRGFDVQAAHIGSFLRWTTGCDQTHNDHAYTFLVRA